jgi:hypothetical protein
MSKFIQAATKRMEKKGTVGTFRRIAHRMGMSTKEAADRIMSNKEAYSAKTVKKANFAKNVSR